MLPIYNDLLKMWSDLGYDLPIKEGKYWLENNFIQAFTRDGTLRKLWKYKVFDDLHIEITPYHNKIKFCEGDFETWEETYQRLKSELQIKIDESLEVIKQTVEDYPDYQFWCMTSTGKDSVVTLALTLKIIPNIKIMFNNTSCDVADTYKIVKSHPDWIITNPKVGIYNYFQNNNYIPNIFSRGCCSIYKEGASIEYFKNNKVDKLIQIMGVRNDESSKRADREYINHNPKWTNKDWYSLLPIRKWTDLDVWLYIIHNNLEINNRYRKGYTRVGCAICCPYQTKHNIVLDTYFYPKGFERWRKILENDFLKNQRWQQVNSTCYEYAHLNGWNKGLFRPEPTEEVINEFMEYKGITDRNVALQYFNKTCCTCGKNVRQNDVLAMNLKMNGRNTNKIYCKKCLMKELNMSKDEWNNNVADFKSQGCVLF